ncbi:MAG TPA: PH domain-containing protein [Nocardioidaceae bacterium]|nr:PH domain-containing protein [Nocardioidaceae bacterium]
MGETTAYRSTFSRVLAVVVVALLGFLLIWLALTRGFDTAGRYVAPAALGALLVWQAYWRPQVEVSDGGVEIRNVWRTVQVPWPALQDVDARLGLRLVTVFGTYQAWAVPAPRRGRRSREVPVSEAAELVVRRWDELRAAGYLDDPRLERPRPRTTLHTVPLTAAVLLLVVSAVVILASG